MKSKTVIGVKLQEITLRSSRNSDQGRRSSGEKDSISDLSKKRQRELLPLSTQPSAKENPGCHVLTTDQPATHEWKGGKGWGVDSDLHQSRRYEVRIDRCYVEQSLSLPLSLLSADLDESATTQPRRKAVCQLGGGAMKSPLLSASSDS